MRLIRKAGAMLSDAKIRAHLLLIFHRLRHSNDGWVPTSDMNLGGLEPAGLDRIRTICEQLEESGLIKFKSLSRGCAGGIVGVSKITGHGSDVVEGLAQARVAVEFEKPVTAEAGADETTSSFSNSVPLEEVAFVVPNESSIPIVREPMPAGVKIEERANAELFTLRPTLWGMSVDLKEAFRRIRRYLTRNKDL
jgi:hypothetical protein